MELALIQKKIAEHANEYGVKYHVTIDQEFALMKLYEELGEFSQSLLIHQKRSRPEKHLPRDQSLEHVASELADVVGMALVNAELLGIDLEKALTKKWLS